jgi:hypothetical protein
VAFGGEGVSYPAHRHRAGEEALATYLADAERILTDPATTLGQPPPSAGPPDVGDDFESLRWFWLPDDVPAEAV